MDREPSTRNITINDLPAGTHALTCATAHLFLFYCYTTHIHQLHLVFLLFLSYFLSSSTHKMISKVSKKSIKGIWK